MKISEINKNSNKRGFTILEMMAVLLLITLIITALFYTNQMIDAARIRSVITDVNSFGSSLGAFYTQYDYLPGDMPNAASYWPKCDDNDTPPRNTCNGNGDGRIAWDSNLVDADWENKLEDARVWEHMSLAGVVKGKYDGSGAGPGVYTPGTVVPKSKFPTTGYRIYSLYPPYDIYRNDGMAIRLGSKPPGLRGGGLTPTAAYYRR